VQVKLRECCCWRRRRALRVGLQAREGIEGAQGVKGAEERRCAGGRPAAAAVARIATVARCLAASAGGLAAAARACLRQRAAAPSGLMSCYLVWVQVRGQRVARPVWRLRGRARARAHPARPLHHFGQALRPPALQRLPPFRPRHIIVLPV
jgi:hypothetical protein